MRSLRSIRILDQFAANMIRNEPKRTNRKPRKQPPRPAAWQSRRAEYLEEVGRQEKEWDRGEN